MHCLSCDKLLSDWEATRKHQVTGEYLDLCNSCLKEVMSCVNIPVTHHDVFIEPDEEEEEDGF